MPSQPAFYRSSIFALLFLLITGVFVAFLTSSTVQREIFFIVYWIAASLRSLGEIFWGIVIGTVFTALTTFFSNRASTRNLQTTLTNSDNARKTDREMNLRKDIYLQTAEAISMMINSISTLGDINGDYNAVGKLFSEKAPILAKVQLIGGIKAIGAITELALEINAAMLRLTQERIALFRLKNEFDSENSIVKQIEEDREQIVIDQKSAIGAGIFDQNKLQRQASVLAIIDDQLKTARETRQDSYNRLMEGQLHFLHRIIEENMQINRFTPTALIAAREELDLPIDSTEYKRIIMENVNAQNENLRRFLNETRGK